MTDDMRGADDNGVAYLQRLSELLSTARAYPGSPLDLYLGGMPTDNERVLRLLV